jgi:hypothetical protein
LGSHEIFYDFTSAYIFGFSLWNWVLFCFSCFNLCLILISEALLISSTLDFFHKKLIVDFMVFNFYDLDTNKFNSGFNIWHLFIGY